MSPRREAFLAAIDRSWPRVEAYLRENPEHAPPPPRLASEEEAAALEGFLGAVALSDVRGALDVARAFGVDRMRALVFEALDAAPVIDAEQEAAVRATYADLFSLEESAA